MTQDRADVTQLTCFTISAVSLNWVRNSGRNHISRGRNRCKAQQRGNTKCAALLL